MAAYTVAFAVWARDRDRAGGLWTYGLGTLLLVNVFIFALVVGPADPFEPMFPVPESGPGPNPLLQNNWFMAVHPPILYSGYAGMSVPFAIAIGGLLAREIGRDWTRSVRRWTLFPWTPPHHAWAASWT